MTEPNPVCTNTLSHAELRRIFEDLCLHGSASSVRTFLDKHYDSGFTWPLRGIVAAHARGDVEVVTAVRQKLYEHQSSYNGAILDVLDATVALSKVGSITFTATKN